MARNYKIEIFEPSVNRQAGEVVGEPTLFRTLWAERTVEGGRDNIYASRMVHQNEAVYSIRWTPGLKPLMLLKHNNDIRPIISIHDEGFRQLQHIKITLSDAPYEADY